MRLAPQTMRLAPRAGGRCRRFRGPAGGRVLRSPSSCPPSAQWRSGSSHGWSSERSEMSRLGAYYQAQLLDHIGALGQVSAQASMAHEALRSKLMSPSGDYAVWATQEMTGWTPRAPDYNYRAYPVNAAMLREAERDAMG